MDFTGSVCPWFGSPQRDLPRHPARIAAVRESEWDRIAREEREDERRRDAMDAAQAQREAAARVLRGVRLVMETKRGKRIVSLASLALAAHKRLAVTGNDPFFFRAHPAAFVMNMNGSLILRFIKAGLYVYKGGKR